MVFRTGLGAILMMIHGDCSGLLRALTLITCTLLVQKLTPSLEMLIVCLFVYRVYYPCSSQLARLPAEGVYIHRAERL